VRYLLILLLAASCAPRIEPVTVEFAGLEVEEMERGVVKLAVHNPNRFAVDIENLGYVVLLERDTLARGRRADILRIPAEDSTTAAFPFDLKLDVGDVLSSVLSGETDTVRLELAGRYSVPGFLGPKKQPFRYRHELALSELFEEFTRPFKKLFGGEDASD
jgi:LEA14-like dessication related protein